MSAKGMLGLSQSNESKAEQRLSAREELIFNVTEDLLVLMEDHGISKHELARRLGKSRSYVTQVLSGARNMTLGTLSDICFEIGVAPEVKLPVEMVEMDAPAKVTVLHFDASVGRAIGAVMLKTAAQELPKMEELPAATKDEHGTVKISGFSGWRQYGKARLVTTLQ